SQGIIAGNIFGLFRPQRPAATATKAALIARPSAQAITLQGSGTQTTSRTELFAPLSVLRIAHTGSHNFVVRTSVANGAYLLVNTVGSYSGSKPLLAREPVAFDIQADGAWSISIEPMAGGGAPAFYGSGDAVSALFAPPPSGTWEIQHDGPMNFIVWLRCGDGVSLVQNVIGPVKVSKVLAFGQSACYWEIEADSNWSLTPR
ncbi:MAG: hypothetical protein ACYC4L_20115, partial [Chloroflexota bacterium]